MDIESLDLSSIKNDIINNVINDMVSYATSDIEKQILKEELKAKIKEKVVITEVDEGQDVINSSSINQTMNELYIDLLTAFGVLNNISQKLSRYNTTHLTYADFIKARINEINDNLEACNYSLTYNHIPSYRIERFRNSDRFDKNKNLLRDRYDQVIPFKCYVNFDEKENHISLPIIRRDNSLRYDEKVATASIKPYFQLGKGFVEFSSSETDVSNAIDESNNTFWSETILSDAPLRVSFDEEKPNVLFIDDNYYYGIENGAVCDLEINFESLNTVNEISLNAYSKYPFNIVAIRYKTTDDEDEPLVEVVTPDNKDVTLRSVVTKNKISYRFPDIVCKKIYILLNQEHYIRDTYIYNPNDIYKNELWFNSKNIKREHLKDIMFKPNYTDRETNSASWSNFNDRLVNLKNEELSNIILNEEVKNRKLIKYEYNYGFYNIGCFNNHFDRIGIYLSKDISLDSNIKTVKIKTKEDHQLDALGNSVTDIEYYITPVESPTQNDWYPILPENTEIINSELLYISGGQRAYLRFQAEEVYELLKNGEVIPADSNDYNYDIDEATGKIWAVQIFNYDYDAVYSIKYKPVNGSDIVNFEDKVTASIESSYGEDKNFIKLKNEPFIDKTIDYCSIKFTDTSHTGIGEEIEVENVTDIANQGASYKNFDYSSNKYQFYINKDTIYFNKPIEKRFLVDVSYRHLISKIKLKAILRRNTAKDGWLTPILKEIKYDIETF